MHKDQIDICQAPSYQKQHFPWQVWDRAIDQIFFFFCNLLLKSQPQYLHTASAYSSTPKFGSLKIQSNPIGVTEKAAVVMQILGRGTEIMRVKCNL